MSNKFGIKYTFLYKFWPSKQLKKYIPTDYQKLWSLDKISVIHLIWKNTFLFVSSGLTLVNFFLKNEKTSSFLDILSSSLFHFNNKTFQTKQKYSKLILGKVFSSQ